VGITVGCDWGEVWGEGDMGVEKQGRDGDGEVS